MVPSLRTEYSAAAMPAPDEGDEVGNCPTVYIVERFVEHADRNLLREDAGSFSEQDSRPVMSTAERDKKDPDDSKFRDREGYRPRWLRH